METVRYIPVLCEEEVQEDIDMPSLHHSFAAQNIGVWLHNHYRDKYRTCQQLSLDLQGWESIPDIAVYPQGALTADWENDLEKVLLPPDLVIEILSPRQHVSGLVSKIHRYFEHGVKSAWLVMPILGQIMIYHPDKTRKSWSEPGDIMRDPVTGIDLPLAEVFV